MSGRIVHTPGNHECEPPRGPFDHKDCPAGAVWQCDCGITWVSLGLQDGGQQRGGGYASAVLKWKREGRRARRKRERRGITSDEVFRTSGTYAGSKPASQVGPPPQIPSGAAHKVDVTPLFLPGRQATDRLKAAERCVLAIQEALTGERPDGVLDYDETRDQLLAAIREIGRAS